MHIPALRINRKKTIYLELSCCGTCNCPKTCIVSNRSLSGDSAVDPFSCILGLLLPGDRGLRGEDRVPAPVLLAALPSLDTCPAHASARENAPAVMFLCCADNSMYCIGDTEGAGVQRRILRFGTRTRASRRDVHATESWRLDIHSPVLRPVFRLGCGHRNALIITCPYTIYAECRNVRIRPSLLSLMRQQFKALLFDSTAQLLLTTPMNTVGTS